MTGKTNTGGAGLNLRVVGTNTQPPKPTENMIWFNTDTRIPHWYFQNDEPSDPELGDVYVTVTTTATNVLQLLRNNGLKLYFGTARQWDGAAWNIIGGKIYYNGSWHNLQTFVYDGTIGDAEMNFNHNVGGYPWIANAGGVISASITPANDSFSFYAGGAAAGDGSCRAPNTIDFTDVSSVKITYSGSGGSATGVTATVAQSISGGVSGEKASVSLPSSSTKKTVTIDTSNVTGSYYLGLHFWSSASGYSWGTTRTIYSIELVS